MTDMKKTSFYEEKYKEMLLRFSDRLLYAAFRKKKGEDYENLSMRGLVITEKEIELAFGLLHRREFLAGTEAEELQRLAWDIREFENQMGGELLFCRLCRDFELTPIESLALLLAAAPAWDRKYERIYGYLQDHVEKGNPTRGLCLTLAELLLQPNEENRDEFLSGGGNLEFLVESLGLGDPKGLSGGFRLRPRVRNHLCGSMEFDPLLKDRCERFSFREALPPMVIREDYVMGLCRLWDALSAEEKEDAESYMILVSGKKGIGKRFLLKHFASRKKRNLLFADISALLYEKEERIREVMMALVTEAILMKAEVVLTGGDTVEETDGERTWKRQDKRRDILSRAGDYFSCFFLLSEEKDTELSDFSGRKTELELPSLAAGEKIALWKAWGRELPLDASVDAEQNGNKYILTPGGIRDALSTAWLLAGMDGSERICEEHIRRAVKQNQKNQLGVYATLINSRFVWEDLILGDEQKRQMRMVCDQLRYRDVVGEKWGFHKKTPYGRGLSVMFYGPPGTGKTMAAQVMANELGLDLYRIDISQMVSKYIGETQKNISELFQKAKDLNALLFFDEADSLFAKRSEAKDSHDRHANSETAHLLQKLEDYEGITVLATNYLNNIDDAFKRRIKFIINIAFPDAEVRLKLWRATLPKEAECEELDLEFFAEHFELAGSSIKEILTNAAYLAAAEHRAMRNSDIVEAVKLNYAKYGKFLTDRDFGYLG